MADNFVKVAQKGDIPPGRAVVVKVGDHDIALCNVNGQFHAIDNVCTHDGGSLDQGLLEGDVIECPRHGARFNVRTGEVVQMPAIVPVGTYPVRVQGSDIEVSLDES